MNEILLSAAAASEPGDLVGPWRAFLVFITHPVAAVILAISWLLTNRLKYFLAQWLPLHIANATVHVWNRRVVDSRVGDWLDLYTVPRLDRICTGPRYILTWCLAGVITYYATLSIGSILASMVPTSYGWDLNTIGTILAILSPLLVLAFFAVAKHSGSSWLRELGDKLGASELSLNEQEREIVELIREAAEDGEDPADKLSRTRIGRVFGKKNAGPRAER